MKARILTIALLAATLGCPAFAKVGSPASPPQKVIKALNDLRKLYGQEDKVTSSLTHTCYEDQTRFLTSSEQIIPFSCPAKDGAATFALADVRDAFEQDKVLAYSYNRIMPGEVRDINVATCDFKEITIPVRNSSRQMHIGMSVINATNPELRDYYGVTWEQKSDSIHGKIFLITSRRPELRKDMGPRDILFKSIREAGVDLSRYQQDICEFICDSVFSWEKYAKIAKKISEDYPHLVFFYDNTNPSPPSAEEIKRHEEALKKIATTKTCKEDTQDGIDSAYNWAKDAQEDDIIKRLKAYKQLLETQEEQIERLHDEYRANANNPKEQRIINKRLRRLHKQAQQTTDKMEQLVNKLQCNQARKIDADTKRSDAAAPVQQVPAKRVTLTSAQKEELNSILEDQRTYYRVIDNQKLEELISQIIGE